MLDWHEGVQVLLKGIPTRAGFGTVHTLQAELGCLPPQRIAPCAVRLKFLNERKQRACRFFKSRSGVPSQPLTFPVLGGQSPFEIFAALPRDRLLLGVLEKWQRAPKR